MAAKLPPGLPLEKIEEIFQILPYRLPQEVYELYQWCGGWDWETENWDTIFAPYYGTMTLCSPQGGMETAKDFEKYEVRYINKPIFPIFGYDKIYLCTVGNWQAKFPAPIVYVSELYTVELHYVSLASLMQVTAKVWETAVAYINEGDLVQCDEQKFFTIYRQYNVELPKMVLTWLKQELEIAGLERCKLYKMWDSIDENVNWLTTCWPELSVEHFSPELIEPIVREMKKPKETSFSHYAKMILEKLKYKS
uniref:SMI1/KNR4 family protein n=1 Tax=Anabaena sp. (strain CA / ATCC 33047) TaxID=52271 RepID=UPI0018DB6C43